MTVNNHNNCFLLLIKGRNPTAGSYLLNTGPASNGNSGNSFLECFPVNHQFLDIEHPCDLLIPVSPYCLLLPELELGGTDDE